LIVIFLSLYILLSTKVLYDQGTNIRVRLSLVFMNYYIVIIIILGKLLNLFKYI
jgi:hypothetical protein